MPVIRRLSAILGKGVPEKDRQRIALKSNTITKLIVEADKVPDPPRVSESGYIHVSSLIRGECPRFLALQKKHKHYKNEFANGATRLMWEIGRAVERHIRAQLIATLPPEQVYGCWKCPCYREKGNHKNPSKPRGRFREGFAKDSGSCSFCGQPAMIYVEVDLTSELYRVCGHPDLILVFDGLLYILEIKSLTNSKSANDKKEGFDTLEKPFVTHVLQSASYNRMAVPLARRLGIPLAKEVIILYASKDFNGFKSPYPYKEFHVNPFPYKNVIQSLFADAKTAYEGAEGVLPPRLDACTSASSKTACNCPLVHSCFKLTSHNLLGN